MEIYANIFRGCYSQQLSFDNGWSCLIEDRRAQGANVIIVPTQIIELLFEQCNDENMFKDYELDAMKKRGDYYTNVKSDNKLVNILGHVKNRPIEKHLANINEMIMKVGK